jgi:hypothetical protein
MAPGLAQEATPSASDAEPLPPAAPEVEEVAPVEVDSTPAADATEPPATNTEKAPAEEPEIPDFAEFLAPAPAAAPAFTAQAAPEKPADPLQPITLMDVSRAFDPDENSADDEKTEPVPSSADPQKAADEDEPDPISQAIDRLQKRPKSLEELRPGYRAPSTEPVKNEEEDEPEFVRAGRRKQRIARISRAVFSIGSVVLLAALVFQGMYSFRNVLSATFPPLNPALAAICQAAQCRLELPRHIDNITLESSEFQSLPKQDNALSLNMLLRNQSQIALAWPSIELTLSDASEKPVIRKVLTPKDYLPKSIDVSKGFPRYSEQSVTLMFRVAELKPEGYHIYLFYP